MLIFIWVRCASKEHFYVNVDNSTRLEHVDEVKKGSKLRTFCWPTRADLGKPPVLHTFMLSEGDGNTQMRRHRKTKETVREKIHKYKEKAT
jgi:hypothetical protein